MTALVTAAVLIGVVSGQRGATATHRGEPAVAPSATTATVGAPVRLLGPDRPLTVELPEGWHALTVEGARGSRAAFLSTQPLSRPTPEGCLADSAHMFPGCRPVSRLAPGGVLIVLRYGDGRGVGPLRMSVASGIDTCAGVGADGGHSADAGSFEVLFSVCQRGPTARTATVIGEILSEMFPDDGT
ncbi:hypothetical protein [Streptomyces sp. NPDC048521]|uniref:hypothetical protein n=1 Tax=Streptomyces sp. NPDC048521 TaxID=3365566 RepID=UPI0037136169